MRIQALVCAAAVAIAPAVLAQDSLAVSLAHGSATEQQTGAQLLRLVTAYDTRAWVFTRAVVVDDSAAPHSHPVLTLTTRYLKDDELLLSTYLHEQLHWFLTSRRADTDAAVGELRTMFPSIPIGFPEGSSDEESNYVHLLVCYLEYQADRRVLGKLRAQEVMRFWADDHYRWIYRAVLDRPRDIGAIASKHHLVPDGHL